jgi:hypothetical protein
MNPIRLTDADVTAAKALCLKTFKHDRPVGVDYTDPITGDLLVTVLVADLDLAAAGAYFDARLESIPNARTVLLQERALFPSQEQLEELRETWPEFDRSIEDRLRDLWGFITGAPVALPLTEATAPPGLDPKLVAGMLAEAGSVRLWAVSRPTIGLACVLRQPVRAIYDLSKTSYGEAWSARRNVLGSWLGIIEDHYVWSPAPTLRAHLEQRPGRLEDLGAAWLKMGGAGAKTSGRRF